MANHIKNAALNLMLDPRASGDHGFQGQQREAWHAQRDAFMRVFRLFLTDSVLTSGTMTLITYEARHRPCPRSVGQHRPGTMGGLNWVSQAIDITLDIDRTLDQ